MNTSKTLQKDCVKVAVVQMNPLVNSLQNNYQQLKTVIEKAKIEQVDLLITPELALTGYPPEDLLFDRDLKNLTAQYLQEIAKISVNMTIVLGHPYFQDDKCWNSASVFRDGKLLGRYDKHSLPNYSVFDEKRYFREGEQTLVFEHQGIKWGILICEDLWTEAHIQKTKQTGAEIILILNASPYELHKLELRQKICQQRIEETGLPIIYVNLVGGQDELVFDGNSFMMERSTKMTMLCPAFSEGMAVLELIKDAAKSAHLYLQKSVFLPIYRHPFDEKVEQFIAGCSVSPEFIDTARLYQALCFAVRDYVHKNSFQKIIIGLSGGIDSALVLAICADSLGSDFVYTFMLPSKFTSMDSLLIARELSRNFNVHYKEIPIDELIADFDSTLKSIFANFQKNEQNTTAENIQARIRGVLLMAFANQLNGLLITTGNKSELAVGYATLYGDMAGGFSPLKDVSKTWVYRLVEFRNEIEKIIPDSVILRPPSAELRADQTDQDDLPPYDILDAIITKYIEEDCSFSELLTLFPEQVDLLKKVITMIDKNEFKRRQSAIGVKVTSRAFGKDWRMPVTRGFFS